MSLFSVPVEITSNGYVLVEAETPAHAEIKAARKRVVGIQPGQVQTYRVDSEALIAPGTIPGTHLVVQSYVVPSRQGKAIAILSSPRTEIYASIHAFHGENGKVVIDVKRDAVTVHTYFLPEEP